MLNSGLLRLLSNIIAGLSALKLPTAAYDGLIVILLSFDLYSILSVLPIWKTSIESKP